jgi:hypothetical protein
MHYVEVRDGLNYSPAAVAAVDSRVVEQIIYHGDPLLGSNHRNPARAMGPAAPRDHYGKGTRGK